MITTKKDVYGLGVFTLMVQDQFRQKEWEGGGEPVWPGNEIHNPSEVKHVNVKRCVKLLVKPEDRRLIMECSFKLILPL